MKGEQILSHFVNEILPDIVLERVLVAQQKTHRLLSVNGAKVHANTSPISGGIRSSAC
jgi:hypothetical protein